MSPFILPPSLLKLWHHTVGPRTRHTFNRLTAMTHRDRDIDVSIRIYSLLSCLDTQTYDEVAAEVGYWTEWALTQQLTTVEKLVEDVSALAWTSHPSPASFARFLKELRDSPRRSAQARSFIDEFCTRVFRSFSAASAEDLEIDWQEGTVANGGGYGFVNAASFIGHLIDCDLLDRELVRLHLIKSLTTHRYPRAETPAETVRVGAIRRLFIIAGDTLVQGLLEPEDVRVCFGILGTRSSRPGGIGGLSTAGMMMEYAIHHDALSAARLEVQCATHLDALHRSLLTYGPGTSRTPRQVVGAE